MTHAQHKMMKDDGVCVFMLIEVCRVAVSVADRWQGVKQSVRGVGRVFLEHRRPFENISPGRRSGMQERQTGERDDPRSCPQYSLLDLRA